MSNSIYVYMYKNKDFFKKYRKNCKNILLTKYVKTKSDGKFDKDVLVSIIKDIKNFQLEKEKKGETWHVNLLVFIDNKPIKICDHEPRYSTFERMVHDLTLYFVKVSLLDIRWKDFLTDIFNNQEVKQVLNTK